MKNRIKWLMTLSVAGGIFLSLFFVNPYEGYIPLSEMVLQLSGSRGSFVLGFSYTELIEFAMRLLPSFLFELYFGIVLYRHFCTASIYVFSRYPHRMRWYLREIFGLGSCASLFHAVLLSTAVVVTLGRYQLQIDSAGLILLIYHFLIYTLWVYTMAVLINVLALFWGSSTAFAWVTGGQLLCIVLLNAGDAVVRYTDGRLTYKNVLAWNPITRLVLGWCQNNLERSVLFCFMLGIVMTAAGAVIITKYDLLVSDLETEAG